MFGNAESFFSYSVRDLAEAEAFYRDVLGVSVERTPEGLSLRLAGGGAGFLYEKPNHEPATFTVLNFLVADVDAAVDALSERGVWFEHYDEPELQTDERGILRGNPTIAWFRDPSDNILSVVQRSA